MKFIASLSNYIGNTIRWLTLLLVLTMTVVVVLRYGFNIGWIALQESTIYMHATALMLGMGYVLQQDGHVRVDIFYRNFDANRKAKINVFGHLFFLIPTCVFLIVMSWNYVLQSWMIWEGSQESGGLPFIFILKSLILIMPVLLILQAMNECAQFLTSQSVGQDPKTVSKAD